MCFRVSTLLDTAVRIAPANLALSLLEAVTQQLEATYVDKVVPQLGLCVTLFEVLEVEGGAVHVGEGCALYTVKFSMVFFCPFVGEVLTGKLKSYDANGLRVSLGFFDDVVVPASCLQEPSEFVVDVDAGEKAWKWRYEGNDIFMERDEEIRVRVKSVRYPPRPHSAEVLSTLAPVDGGMLGPSGPLFAPMVVVADINSESGTGLGMLSWWK